MPKRDEVIIKNFALYLCNHYYPERSPSISLGYDILGESDPHMLLLKFISFLESEGWTPQEKQSEELSHRPIGKCSAGLHDVYSVEGFCGKCHPEKM